MGVDLTLEFRSPITIERLPIGISRANEITREEALDVLAKISEFSKNNVWIQLFIENCMGKQTSWDFCGICESLNELEQDIKLLKNKLIIEQTTPAQ